MLDLEPLIAGLVEDIFRAIRHASVDELRQLRNGQDAPSASSPSARTAGPRASLREPRGRRATPRAPAARPESASRSKRIATLPQHAPEPAPFSEITDPEQLLGATTTQGPARSAALPPVEVEAEPPASGPLPANGRALRLREGETLARSTGDGIVIRRPRSV
jgi:hypothetical protein